MNLDVAQRCPATQTISKVGEGGATVLNATTATVEVVEGSTDRMEVERSNVEGLAEGVEVPRT